MRVDKAVFALLFSALEKKVRVKPQTEFIFHKRAFSLQQNQSGCDLSETKSFSGQLQKLFDLKKSER